MENSVSNVVVGSQRKLPISRTRKLGDFIFVIIPGVFSGLVEWRDCRLRVRVEDSQDRAIVGGHHVAERGPLAMLHSGYTYHLGRCEQRTGTNDNMHVVASLILSVLAGSVP
jgi:hypothetical protein